MGLFSATPKCCICNTNPGKLELADGNICKVCLRSGAGFLSIKPTKNMYVREVQSAIENVQKSQELSEVFKPTKKIGEVFTIDEEHKLWAMINMRGKYQVYKIEDILEYEILEDGDSITKGGLGSAVAGGVLFGGVGAIVGSITGGKTTKRVINKLQVRLTFKDISVPAVFLNLLTMSTKTNSMLYDLAYKNAQEIISTLSILTSNTNNVQSMPQNTQQNTLLVADEISKLKTLFDSGILTQEEYNQQKNKILNS